MINYSYTQTVWRDKKLNQIIPKISRYFFPFENIFSISWVRISFSSFKATHLHNLNKLPETWYQWCKHMQTKNNGTGIRMHNLNFYSYFLEKINICFCFTLSQKSSVFDKHFTKKALTMPGFDCIFLSDLCKEWKMVRERCL